jgi:hypothetical protein
MLKARQQQLDVYSQNAMADFEGRAVSHLRRDLAQQTISFTDTDLLTRVRSCIPRAAKYNLTSEKHVMCFVDVSFLLGEHFDLDESQPWAAKLLRSDRVAPGDKGNLLLATACSVYKDTRASK